MPVINAVLNNPIAIYFDIMVFSIVNRNNTGCSTLVPLVEIRRAQSGGGIHIGLDGQAIEYAILVLEIVNHGKRTG
jgi:hypothetical protein